MKLPLSCAGASYFNSGEADDNDGRRTWYLDVMLFSLAYASTDVRLAGLWVMPMGFELDASTQGRVSVQLTAQIFTMDSLHTRRFSIFSRIPETRSDVDGESSDVDT